MKKPDNFKKFCDATLNNLKEGFQLIGHNWKYLYVNDAFVKQCKFSSKSDLIGTTFTGNFTGVKNTFVYNSLKDCMVNRASDHFEFKIELENSLPEWLEFRVEPVPHGLMILSVKNAHKKNNQKNEEKTEDVSFFRQVKQPTPNLLGLSRILSRILQAQYKFDRAADYFNVSIQSIDIYTEELTNFIRKVGGR